ncbi:MAG: dTDP-4-dehydrorhamnose reductase [Pyrinomonadaceae bacterium]|nr:dTDP-4-dehydrorhamnose reductase [Pyrinomonadaceae bacterium]
MKLLVTGAGGMVGRAVAAHCASLGDEVLACDHAALDITDAAALGGFFERERPEAVINCAAWTDVDACQSNPERAFLVNTLGPENLAVNCRRRGALLVTLSTDYVFDGEKEGFYTQRDDPNPQSVYAAAKLEGERRAQAASARTIVVRTGWIFGEGGRNFLSTAVRRVLAGERLKLIRDAYGTPTYAPELAARLRRLAERDIPGIFHVVSGGEGASYEEFVQSALTGLAHDRALLESVSFSSLQRPAPRPVNSRLACLLSEALGMKPLPHWQEGLKDFVARTLTSVPSGGISIN